MIADLTVRPNLPSERCDITVQPLYARYEDNAHIKTLLSSSSSHLDTDNLLTQKMRALQNKRSGRFCYIRVVFATSKTYILWCTVMVKSTSSVGGIEPNHGKAERKVGYTLLPTQKKKKGDYCKSLTTPKGVFSHRIRLHGEIHLLSGWHRAQPLTKTKTKNSYAIQGGISKTIKTSKWFVSH